MLWNETLKGILTPPTQFAPTNENIFRDIAQLSQFTRTFNMHILTQTSEISKNLKTKKYRSYN